MNDSLLKLFKDILWKIGGKNIRQWLLQESLKQWRVFSAKEGDQLLALHRLRIERPQLPKGVEFNWAIIINWPYTSDSPFPSEEIRSLMLEFETYLEDLSTDNGFAELVSMRFGFGNRQWLYYSCDTDKFMASFNALLSGHPQYPIDIAFIDDPDWKWWKEMVEMWSAAQEKQ